jgi:hypothetical protein
MENKRIIPVYSAPGFDWLIERERKRVRDNRENRKEEIINEIFSEHFLELIGMNLHNKKCPVQ